MKKLVLYGAGGLAREIAFMVERINKVCAKYELLGFIVDEKYFKPDTYINGYPVLGCSDWLIEHKDEVVCTCAIAEPCYTREFIQEKFEKLGVKFETIIDEGVDIHKTVKIGEGCIISRGVTFTVNVEVGKGTFINGHCHIGHDVTINKYCCIYSGVSINGYAQIGDKVKIGGAAYICPKVKIREGATVAAGSVVFSNVKADTTVLGNPAKRIVL